MKYSKALLSVLDSAGYEMDPLYAACYSGDCAAVKRLALCKSDPNIKQWESGYTPLHAAVFRCHLQVVINLLNGFRGVLHLHSQDSKGDTPLHLAAAGGLVEIAAAICDEPHCDPLTVRNYLAQYPIDIVKNHKVFQMIKMCQDRNTLKQQLQELKETRSIRVNGVQPS